MLSSLGLLDFARFRSVSLSFVYAGVRRPKVIALP
jgi:hypothetical protein